MSKPTCPFCLRELSAAGGVVNETESRTTEWTCYYCKDALMGEKPITISEICRQHISDLNAGKIGVL